ncbi:uncharacterized protein [Apostichopus japonicus]|uniref:uncharacterized protein n=1 Tax=Stichopus japonicus TaxID=307972 RepID=UPI003AB8A739
MENTSESAESSSHEVYEDPYTSYPNKQILITVYVTIFFLGFTGNLMVIFVIAQNRNMRTVTNFFLGNLALSDLLAMTCSDIPILVTYVSDSWPFGEIVCICAYFLISITTTASILILAVISVERYMAILHPFELRKLVTTKLLSITVCVIWTISILLGLPVLFSYKVIVYDNVEFCTATGLGGHFFAVQSIAKILLLYLIPLMVMCILYGAIGRTLWATSPDVKFSQCNGGKTKKEKEKTAVAYRTSSSVITFANAHSSPGATKNGPPPVTTKTESPPVSKVGPFYLEEPMEDDEAGVSADSDYFQDGNDNIRFVNRKSNPSSPSSRTTPSPKPKQDKKWSIFKSSCDSKGQGGSSGFKSLTSSRNSKRRRKTEAVRAARRKAVRMLAVIALCFGLCLFPIQLISLLSTLDVLFDAHFELTYQAWFYPFAHASYFFNSALNPFLYAFLSNKFRKSFWETITCQSNRKRRGRARCIQRIKSATSDVNTEVVYVP